MQITEREFSAAQGLITRDREKQLQLNEFDANSLHTIIHAYNNDKPVKEDIGDVLYRIKRKFREE